LKTKVDRLRDEALRLLREDEALAFVISPAGRDGREMAERNRIALQSGTRQSLQRYIDSVSFANAAAVSASLPLLMS